MSTAGVLTRLRGKPAKREYLTVDLEARAWVNPYAIGAYDGDKYLEEYGDGYGCVSRMVGRLLVAKYAGKWIYAHNGGNYDFLFLLRVMLSPDFRLRFRVELTPAGSTIIKMEVVALETGKHKVDCSTSETTCTGCVEKRIDGKLQHWTFLDSAKLMPLPLADIGAAFGITRKVKLEMSYDDLAKPENRELMEHYLRTDCVSLHEAIGVMHARINGLGGQIGITLPATSLDLFRRVYQRDDIQTNRHWLGCPVRGKTVSEARNEKLTCVAEATEDGGTSCLHDFARQAYFGGPSQIFRMKFVGRKAFESGTLPLDEATVYDPKFPVAKMYDINSHYPDQMLAPMPVGEAMELPDVTEEKVYSMALSHVGIVECDVEIPEGTYLPPLPVNLHGKMVFPSGKLRGTWDAAELRLLLQVGGRIAKIHRSIWYETSPVFVDFIREVYRFRDKKREGWTKGMDWIAKILLNASYGKFAMREQRSKILVHPSLRDGLKAIDMHSDVWSEDVTVSPSYIIPQLSVHITALARVKLWKLLKKIVDGGGRIYYTDTDSVVCAGVELPTGPGLGALKLEATIHRASFVLPKLYLVETEEADEKKTEETHLKIKSKGMGPGIRLGVDGDDPLNKQLSEKEFLDVTRNGLVLSRHRLTRLKESLREYAKSSTEFPRVVASPKQMRSAYDKRTVMLDFDSKSVYVDQW